MLTKRTKCNLDSEQYDVIRPKNNIEANSSFVNALRIVTSVNFLFKVLTGSVTIFNSTLYSTCVFIAPLWPN